MESSNQRNFIAVERGAKKPEDFPHGHLMSQAEPQIEPRHALQALERNPLGGGHRPSRDAV